MIERRHSDLCQQSVAMFSRCERYRYRLTRQWDESKPGIAYLMLNPSTADERVNDPTIERCQRRAVAMGFGSMTIANLFPIRLTDSTQLHLAGDLLGDLSAADTAIVDAVTGTAMTVCGWGKHELAAARANEVMKILRISGLVEKLHCLVVNKDGSPKHPLYVGYDVKPQPFSIRRQS